MKKQLKLDLIIVGIIILCEILLSSSSFILFLLLKCLSAQSSIFQTDPGYIKISSDTTMVPIYVDGVLVGHTPIEKPIPVLQGTHEVSHQPPSIRDPFIQYGKIKDMRQIYVFSGDTVNVFVNTDLLEKSLKNVKKEYRNTNYIGMGLSFIFLIQLWLLTG